MLNTTVLAYSLDQPFAPWIFQYLLSGLAVALIIVGIVRSVRFGELSFVLLVTVSGLTMWWQEWYADWGVYLLYSPKLDLMKFWGATQWASPNKPWCMPLAYAWFYGTIFVGMNATIQWVRRKRPSWPLIAVVLIVAVPFFYLWDLFVEGIATGLGWWTYFDAVGPTIRYGHTNMPLLHPLLVFTVYGTLVAYLFARAAPQQGPNYKPQFESLAGVDRLPARWRRETARLGLYVVVMNMMFFVFMSIPMIAIREIWGHANPYVP